MAAVRASSVRRIGSTIKVSFNMELVQRCHYHHSVCVNLARLPSDSPSHPYYKRELQSAKNQFSNLASESFGSSHQFGTRANLSFKPAFSSYCFRSALPFASASHVLNRRSYSSTVGGDKGSRDAGTEVAAGSGASDMNTTGDSVVGGDWAERIKDALKSVVESASYAGEKVKATSDDLTPYAQQLLDSHPYLDKLTLISSGVMVAPTTITAEYLAPVWRGAVIVSFVWFLHRWKTNVFARTLTSQSLLGLDREKVLALDKISSIGLFVIGIMAFAEACGVAVQSIVTVGGIGGVATAFAAKDILGNVFSGLSMQFSKPFSIGDTIKAGSIEGQVVEMGLTTTSLLSSEKFPVIVPNSFFSSQVIVNKSRAEYRAIISKIPLQTEDLSKIPQISDDVKSMLRSNAKVFLGKDVPYCFLSRIESSFAELTLGYNLKHMRKDELYSAEQEILLLAVQIIKNHGVALGSTWQEMPSK
ncbi:mechanosensitive ion channel protein 1, mitochondrial-like isoform X3 [Phaseolus vulgaris]|uniref:mechanosensitive ion channel protein 1, mitochondrial-like isoform X3 n=1 Tax=Phaseolus vulgaris TaxID=3885 RepID=UPI0035CB4BFB